MSFGTTPRDARDADAKSKILVVDTLNELLVMARADQAEMAGLKSEKAELTDRLAKAETYAARLKAELDGRGNPQ